MANVALFLASDLSSYMTGTVPEVTGGGTHAETHVLAEMR